MTILNQISQQQYARVVASNENFEAVSAAGMFGINHALSVGLVFAFYGGHFLVDGVLTTIADSVVTLTASATNYIERTRAGVVTKNTTGFTAGQIPLYTAVTTTIGIDFDQLIDYRDFSSYPQTTGMLVKAMPSDANYTLTAAEARNRILSFVGGTTLTATRNIVLPLAQKEYIVHNGTTGAQSLQFIGASGTGITVATAKRAIILADGTNVVRVTADV